jgi:hypothetical protein
MITPDDYLKLDDARPGMMVTVDGGFTCMDQGDQRTIVRDADGDLCIPCREGMHGLAGQVDDHGRLIGIFDARDTITRLFVDFDVTAWVGDYEFVGDDGCHVPTDHERALLEDAIAGVVSEIHEQLRPPLEARDAMVRDAWSRQHGLNADGTPRRETVPACGESLEFEACDKGVGDTRRHLRIRLAGGRITVENLKAAEGEGRLVVERGVFGFEQHLAEIADRWRRATADDAARIRHGIG